MDRIAYTLFGCVGILLAGCAYSPPIPPQPSGCIDVAFAGTELTNAQVYACGITSNGRFSCVSLEDFLNAARSVAPEGQVDL